MPFIEAAISEAVEAEAVPEGEYDLRVVKVADEVSKKGNPMTHVTIVVDDPDYPNALPVNFFLVIPPDDHEYKGLMLNNLKRFLYWTGVPFEGNGYDSDDIDGVQFKGRLTQDEPDDNGIIRNSLVFPPVPGEAEEDRPKKGRRRASR